MKKLLISFFVSLCFFSLAFSFDFGLNIQNYTSFLKQDESQTFVQSNTASLWASQRAETYEAAGSGSYTFNYVKTVDTNLIDRGIFDLDYLYYTRFLSFEDQVVDTLDVQVGRFFTNNVNTYVFNSKLDGLKAEASLNNLSFGAQILYTGLLLNKTSPIKMSVGDSENTDNFGSKRIIYSAYALFDEFVSRQNAHFEFVGQNDLNAYEDDSLDSYYLSLGLNGSIIPSLGYNLDSVYELVNSDQVEQYVLIDGKLQLAVPSVKGQFSAGGVFSFALQDSDFGFQAITEKPLSFVDSSIMARNVQSLLLAANFNFTSFFSLSTKLQSYIDKKLGSGDEAAYKGTELGLICNLIPTSDFSVSISGGVLFLDKNAVVEEGSATAFKVSLAASIFI
jgi:hypothetical protein